MNEALQKTIFLADDDTDDCILFEDALREICTETALVIANDGIELMAALMQHKELPDVVFLDLNMPRKNGPECLLEIRSNKRLQHIPIVIFSTSAQDTAIEQMYTQGANLYIRKPDTFPKLKQVIRQILSIDWQTQARPDSREAFFAQF
jgi:CheY-like chemotaxis protein